jgi:hypothetical protein
MAVAILMTIEATEEQYDAVNEKIDPAGNPPAGLIIHVGSVTGSGVRVIDVWESEQAFNDFRESRLGPAVGEVMGGDAGPPNIEVLELHDVVKP